MDFYNYIGLKYSHCLSFHPSSSLSPFTSVTMPASCAVITFPIVCQTVFILFIIECAFRFIIYKYVNRYFQPCYTNSDFPRWFNDSHPQVCGCVCHKTEITTDSQQSPNSEKSDKTNLPELNLGVQEYPIPYWSSSNNNSNRNNRNNTINPLPTRAIDNRERNGKAEGLAKKFVDKWEENGIMEVIARTVVENWARNGTLEQVVTAGQWRQKLRELRDGARQRALAVTPSSEEGEYQ